MPRYAITERAGPFVAGIRNTGVGTVLDLTERQAEHEQRLGTLVVLPEPQERAVAEFHVNSPAIADASLEQSIPLASEQEAGSPPSPRKPKRSTT